MKYHIFKTPNAIIVFYNNNQMTFIDITDLQATFNKREQVVYDTNEMIGRTKWVTTEITVTAEMIWKGTNECSIEMFLELCKDDIVEFTDKNIPEEFDNKYFWEIVAHYFYLKLLGSYNLQ